MKKFIVMIIVTVGLGCTSSAQEQIKRDNPEKKEVISHLNTPGIKKTKTWKKQIKINIQKGVKQEHQFMVQQLINDFQQ